MKRFDQHIPLPGCNVYCRSSMIGQQVCGGRASGFSMRVLYWGPRRKPEGIRAVRKPLVEGADIPSVREDLRPGEV